MPTDAARSPACPRVLSFGGGVNSVALLLRLVREGRAPDRVVFADTGEEEPRTYAYVRDYVEPFCREQGIPFDTVRSHHGRMVDYYTRQRAVPSIQKRDCTSKFKRDPIRRHLRALGYRQAVVLIGIAADEAGRMRDSDVAWLRNEYPLCEWRMKRADCEAEISAAGWPSPGKSGCRACPFSGKRAALRLLRDDPEDFDRWRRMEEGNSRFPSITVIPNVRLGWLAKAARDQTTLDVIDGGECVEGACSPAEAWESPFDPPLPPFSWTDLTEAKTHAE